VQRRALFSVPEAPLRRGQPTIHLTNQRQVIREREDRPTYLYGL